MRGCGGWLEWRRGAEGSVALSGQGPVTDRRAALVASRVLPRRSPALAENTALPDAPIALRLHMKASRRSGASVTVTASKALTGERLILGSASPWLPPPMSAYFL